MATSEHDDTLRDLFVQVQAEHSNWYIRRDTSLACAGTADCKWTADPHGDRIDRQFRTHVADALLAVVAPVLAERQAGAWDEGVHAAFQGAITRQNAEDVKRYNPYRKEATDG